MAIYKCKMCGGSLEVSDNSSVVTCEYCSSVQTLPKKNDEIINNLFNRANNLRLKCEFDKAAEVYEKILNEDNNDSEAHWGLVLCKYGIEYVEDPKTFNRIATCHRTQYESVLTDVDYLAAVSNADALSADVYKSQAEEIANLQKDILAIVKNEKPFDVFLCYKQTDENGKRTVDSALANDIYYQLTQEGMKVFYAAITLEDKLGVEYEPYIFAALNSAKVMLVIGTKPEYFEAVWVKNEWSRYLKLMKEDRSRLLIPCYRDMDAYDLPEEFSHLQAQDMSKIGFVNDVVRGIRKIVKSDEPKSETIVKETVVTTNNDNTAPLLKRAFMFLEDGEWANADEYCEKVLDINPECAEAYLGKLMAEIKVKKQGNLKNCSLPFDNNANYQKAVRFGNDALVKKIKDDNSFIIERNEKKRIEEQKRRLEEIKRQEEARIAEEKRKTEEKNANTYANAVSLMNSAAVNLIENAHIHFVNLGDYKDSKEQSEKCLEKIYNIAVEYLNGSDSKMLTLAIREFEYLGEYKDSKAKKAEAEAKIKANKEKKKALVKKGLIIGIPAIVLLIVFLIAFSALSKASQYNEALAFAESGKYRASNKLFEELGDYKDSKDRILINNAAQTLERGDKAKAAMIYAKVNDEEFKEKAFALWDEIAVRETVSAGADYTVAIKTDGSVVATGNNSSGQCNVSDWSDIIAVSAGFDYTVGLKSDGTVVAVGNNKYNQCLVSGWKDIVAISAGDRHTVGLKADGTVVATNLTFNSEGQCNVSGWTDIVAISAGECSTIGLKSDGNVVYAGSESYELSDVTYWSDIVGFSVGNYHIAGVKSDGSAVADGVKTYNRCEVYKWKDIVAVSAGTWHTVALKSNGTVVSTVFSDDTVINKGQSDVLAWTDIVAISAGSDHTIGLKSDGTVVATGDNDKGQCNVSEWNNIKLS